ncbi:MAG: NAD(P)H-dependent oxidoreductase [Rubrivivax sp.]|nr:NAD(P)H-dependent oxidoreductase [Rubrivivax sp.]
MKTLLVVYHSMTGGSRQMAEAAAVAATGAGVAAAAEATQQAGAAVGTGTGAPDAPLRVRLLRAAEAGPRDVLGADGYLFVAPENLAALAGLMKDFFDRCYYAALGRIEGRPYAALICAGSDGQNAACQLERIATGWRLRQVAPTVIVNVHAQTPEQILREKVIGEPDRRRCAEVGAALAAGLVLGVF